MNECGNLAIDGPPFALNAAEENQPWKNGSVFGRRDDAGPAPLEAIMAALALFMKVEIAARVGLRESRDRASVERPVVALEFEGVMRARRADAFGHF